MSEILKQIVDATVKGDEERCVALARQAVEAGLDPLDIIQKGFAEGMHIVGDLFAKLDYFLPEVMLAADAMTSAVDLLKGIGVYAGLKPITVKGATGYLDTNYAGKAQEALTALNGLDFMFVHVEAPDEASHNGNAGEKIEAIEAFDEKVVGTVLTGLDQFSDYRIMVASDHFTPISIKTHATDPAPFAWATKAELASKKKGIPFTEASARESGIGFEKGFELMPSFLSQA